MKNELHPVGRKCEWLREKPSRYLIATNPSGKSYQKCGRKATTETQGGTPLCSKCSKLYLYQH